MAHIKRKRTARGEVRYEVRYRVADGSERSRTLRTRKDAERFAATATADLLRGAWVDPRSATRTFDPVASEWLSSNPAKRPSSWARDESVLRVHLSPAIGAKAIGAITRADVQRVVHRWTQNLAPRTVRSNYGVLRAVFGYAVDAEYLVASPCRSIRLPTPQAIEALPFDATDLAALADALGEDFAAMAYLGAVLGLRWGECAALRVGRLDLLGSRLTVCENLVRGTKGAITFGPPKSAAGHRTLSMPEPMVHMLAAHLARRGVTGRDSHALVIADSRGGPLRYENWRARIWSPAVAAAGLPGLRFHDLRRANATAMVLDRVDLKTAQTRLGHADPRLTLAIYAQATEAAERAAASRLGDRFFNDPGLREAECV